MLLSLGDFRFSIDTAPLDGSDTNAEYPWASVDRLGKIPQLQAMGQEHRTMTLHGVVITSYKGGAAQIETLRAIAARMEPMELVTGDGRALGRWCVMSIRSSDSHLFTDGVPRRQDYSISLERFDDGKE